MPGGLGRGACLLLLCVLLSVGSAYSSVVAGELLPESTLALRLTGIVLFSDGTGKAILSEEGGEDRLYSEGDILPFGARLVGIRRGQVILLHRGVLQWLATEGLMRSDVVYMDSPISAYMSEAGVVGREDEVVKHPRLDLWREEVMERPSRLLERIELQPVADASGLSGYRVAPRRREEFLLFRRVGLQPGDLVTHVNGHPVLGTRQASKAIEALSHDQEVLIEVVRRGGSTPVILRFECAHCGS